MSEHADPHDASVRIDRWLWAARFFKTRSLAKSAVEGGKVALDGRKVKPAKELRAGQMLEIRRGDQLFVVKVLGVAEQRGPAKVAQTLYEETPESLETRLGEQARRRMERAGLKVPVKPNKKQMRDLRKLKQQSETSP